MDIFPPGKQVDAFLNVHSGWDDGSGCSDQLKEVFAATGHPLRIHRVRRGVNVEAAVRRSLAAGSAGIVAGGGDGTLNGVASALRETEIPMAVLPIGTLNHLARDLGVPLDINKAIEVLNDSRIEQIDLGEVNGRIFLNNSIIGLFPAFEFAKERSLRNKRAKWLAILSALISVIRRNPELTVRLKMAGRELVRRTPYILIANNEHRMQGYEIGNRDRIDQGRLWVYVMRRRSRWGLLKLGLSLLFGRFRKQNHFETYSAESVDIGTRKKRLGVALDGDVKRMDAPLHYRSLPGALRVIAPKNAQLKGPEVKQASALI